jgi:hypothetical protein
MCSPVSCLKRPFTLVVFAVGTVSLSTSADDSKLSDEFPRRALFIQVNHYLYLNPLTTSLPQKNREAIDRFAAALHVPNWRTNNQLFILSDNILPPADRLPTKATIVAGIRQFCETSRAQDRILVYFRGHAFEKNEKAFFAPIEGDVADLNTMIPVADIYDTLKACRATQKIVVWDVCPRNPERTPIRPASGPMKLELFLALLNPPTGVQAIVPCIPAEYSYEYSTPKGEAGNIPGSVLFDALRKALEDTPATKKAGPSDSFPIVEAFPLVEKFVESAASTLGTKQTVKLVGNAPPTLALVDPKEPLPAAVSFPVSGSSMEVKAILHELVLPPLFADDGADPLPPLSFDAKILKPYLPDASIDEIFRDGEKYPQRLAVLKALQVINNIARPGGPKDAKRIVAVKSPVSEALKKTVLDAQAPLAVAIAKLEDELAALEAAGKLLPKETKRWQAHYDYTLGQVRLRLALLNEYNLILGHVRTESLPELPSGSTGWRLTHTDKMSSKKNIQELADAAQATFAAVVAANKGTPWEVLAKRTMLTPPGLRWEPVVK